MNLIAFVASFLLLMPSVAVADSHVDLIRHRGKLVVMAYPEQGNPFMSVDARHASSDIHDPKRYIGIDASLIDVIADRLGVAVYYEVPKRISVQQLVEAVKRGKVDVAASALTINDIRLQKVDFSSPYYSFQPIVIVHRDSTIHELDDLSGKTAVVGRGSSLETHLRRAGFAGNQLILTQFSIGSVIELVEYRADFLLEDPDIGQAIVTTNSSLQVAFSFPVYDRYGIAVPKGSDLVDLINQVIAEFKASGELNQLIGRHKKEREPR